MLLALAGRIRPAGRLRAALTTAALFVASAQAVVLGNMRWYKQSGAIEPIIIPAAILGGCLILAAALRRRRGWRFVLGADLPRSAASRQFSIRALLASVGIVAVLLAVGRATMPHVRWDDIGGLSSVAFVLLVFAPLGTAYGLPALALAAALLSPRPATRDWSWAGGLLAAAVMLTAMTFGVLFGVEGSLLLLAVVVAAYGSIASAFLVLRVCGYRLVRRQPSAAETDYRDFFSTAPSDI